MRIASPHARIPRVTRRGVAVAGLVAVATTVGLSAGSAGASGPSPLFSLSAITATPLSAQSATRFSVSVSGVSPSEEPAFTWTLTLDGPAGARACDNQPLAGATRIAADTYRWVSQGPSFVWYHGGVGSDAADPAYGCSPGDIGEDGYPGSVSVLAENAVAHCTAVLHGAVRRVSASVVGPPALCAIGGYTVVRGLVPVSTALLRATRALNGELGGLLDAVRAGRLTAAAFARDAAAIRARQQAIYTTLYPPVWSCSFVTLLDDATSARALIAAASATGSTVTDAGLAAALGALASEVSSCAGGPDGAPRAVVDALRTLASEASGRSPMPPAVLGRSLTAILTRDVPDVYGMTFDSLVARAVSERAALARAGSALAARDAARAASALQGTLASERALGAALERQARHVAVVTNNHS